MNTIILIITYGDKNGRSLFRRSLYSVSSFGEMKVQKHTDEKNWKRQKKKKGILS